MVQAGEKWHNKKRLAKLLAISRILDYLPFMGCYLKLSEIEQMSTSNLSQC